MILRATDPRQDGLGIELWRQEAFLLHFGLDGLDLLQTTGTGSGTFRLLLQICEVVVANVLQIVELLLIGVLIFLQPLQRPLKDLLRRSSLRLGVQHALRQVDVRQIEHLVRAGGIGGGLVEHFVGALHIVALVGQESSVLAGNVRHCQTVVSLQRAGKRAVVQFSGAIDLALSLLEVDSCDGGLHEAGRDLRV